MLRFILVGGTRIVYYVSRQLIAKGHHVTIIDKNPDKCRELAHKTKATVVLGSASRIPVLEEAGARRTDMILGLTTADQDNLITCQLAQRIFGVPRTLALCNDPENEAIFRNLGIQVAISPSRIIGSLIEQQTMADKITNLMPAAEGKISIADVYLDRNSPALGKTLSELELPEGTLIGSIIRQGHVIVPRGFHKLQLDDHLLVISSHPDRLDEDVKVLTGE
ncbi:MAG: potassium channel family protein [Anaerolineales bacterium]